MAHDLGNRNLPHMAVPTSHGWRGLLQCQMAEPSLCINQKCKGRPIKLNPFPSLCAVLGKTKTFISTQSLPLESEFRVQDEYFDSMILNMRNHLQQTRRVAIAPPALFQSSRQFPLRNERIRIPVGLSFYRRQIRSAGHRVEPEHNQLI